MTVLKPREILSKFGKKIVIRLMGFDGRGTDENKYRAMVTYVDTVHKLYHNGKEIGWYGWSDKEKAVIVNLPSKKGYSHYFHVFGIDIVKALALQLSKEGLDVPE